MAADRTEPMIYLTTETLMTRDKGFYKHLFILMAPIVLQNIISLSVSLSDNIMVGSLGEVALSGVYVANQLQSILQMLVTGIGAALIVISAQYWGQQDVGSVRKITAIALKFALLIALVLTALTFLFPEQILSLFTSDRAVVRESLKYFSIIRFTYLFFCVTQVLVASMRCVENVRIGMLVSLLALFFNVTLNWLLIFGHCGLPAMGIRGSAVATLTARIAETSAMLLYVKFGDRKLHLTLRAALRTDWLLARDFFHYGFPVILGDILWGVNLAVQGAIVGRLGADAIASVSIANLMFSLISVGVYGAASASSIVIGKTVGAGDYAKVKEYAKTLQVLFVLLGLVTGVLLYAVKGFYITLLYPNLQPQTVKIANQFMIILSITVVGTSYQMSTLTGIVRAGGATHFVLINDFIFVWFVVIPSALLAAFVFHAAPWVVFACLKCDQILKCFVAVVKVNRYHWMRDLTHSGAA